MSDQNKYRGPIAPAGHGRNRITAAQLEVSRAAYNREERAYTARESHKIKLEIMTATDVRDLRAVAVRAKGAGLWTDELKTIGTKQMAFLEKYTPGINKAARPQTLVELTDSREMWHVADKAAKERIALRDAEAFELPEMPTLADLLAEDDEDQPYRIQGLIPTGGRIILSAPMKSGKTTLVGNLVRSLADGDKFLGRFDVEPLTDTGTITILDTEMSKRQMKSWLRDQGIQNPQRIHPLSLRGSVESFGIMDPATRTIWADQLREMNTEILILDPFGPVLDAFGIDENSNAIGPMLAAIDALAQEAGIAEVFIMHHTGHEGERARGHSKLRGWPDAEWHIRRNMDDESDPTRYFKAFGRDVDVPEEMMVYDATTRHLTMADPFNGQPVNRVTAKTTGKLQELRDRIIDYVTDNDGCTYGDLSEHGGVAPYQRSGKAALESLLADGSLTMTKIKTSKHLYIGTSQTDAGTNNMDDLL